MRVGSGTLGREQALNVLLMAAWFGAVTGVVEVLNLGMWKLVFREFIDTGPSFVWMIPLAELSFMLVPGVVLALIALRRPRLVAPRTAAFVFAFLGSLSVLLFYPQLHALASVVLAAGLGAWTARAIASHPSGFKALARRSLGWMGLLVATLGLAMHAERVWSESRVMAQLPPTARDTPNVLLVVLDTVRARNLSLYGYNRRTTPNLELMARTGVRFDRALSTSPWTLPSHASMFTGRWPHELSADWVTPLDDAHPTLARLLAGRGYRTGGFVANTIYGTYEYGLNRGFVHYEDFSTSPGQLVASSALGRRIMQHKGKTRHLRPLINNHDNLPLGRKTAPKVNRDFLTWLDDDRELPFFAFLNYMEAHQPYDPPPPFDTSFGSGTSRKRSVLEAFQAPRPSAEERRRLRVNAYDACIAYLDQQIGVLLLELRARGALENTLVVVTSDHGEQLGEHGLLGHGNSLYVELLHVPLLISFPGRVPAGVSVGEFVTLRDLPATVIDLLGMSEEVQIPGNSLARLWGGNIRPPEGREILLSEVSKGIGTPPTDPISRGAMTSLVRDGFHYIKNHGDGREELYDLAADPSEELNLVGSVAGRERLASFRAELALRAARSRVPR